MNAQKIINKKKKVLLVSNSSWYLYNFRFQLLKDLLKQGFEVCLIAPKDKYTKKLIDAGFNFYNWKLCRFSINPFKEIISIFQIYKLYKNLKPDLTHHFTIKPCFYGTIAAKFSNTNLVINAITGLGYVFSSNTQKARILRYFLKPLYKIILNSKRSTVIFQNNNDLEKLCKFGITNLKNSNVISSSGVDVNYFYPSKLKIKNNFNLLFPSRVIPEKGFQELIKAVKILWKKGLEFNLHLAGEIDNSVLKSLKKNFKKEIEDFKTLIIHGKLNDMKEIYIKSDLVVLPSWREGLSKSLIEAASMEMPIITTDVPGCNDVIDHGINGLIVPIKDYQSISLAIELLILNPLLAERFGKAARKKVRNTFEIKIVNNFTINQYYKLLNLNNSK